MSHRFRVFAACAVSCLALGVGQVSAQTLTTSALTLETVQRMASYFARHEVDRQGEGWGKDSKGWQAWLGWGGDAGRAWAESILRKHLP